MTSRSPELRRDSFVESRSKIRYRIVRAVTKLADDPRPRGVRELRGHEDVYRIRVDSYRVLYSICDARLVILVLKLGHRGDVSR